MFSLCKLMIFFLFILKLSLLDMVPNKVFCCNWWSSCFLLCPTTLPKAASISCLWIVRMSLVDQSREIFTYWTLFYSTWLLYDDFVRNIHFTSWYTQHCLHNHACIHTHMGYEPIMSIHTQMTMQPIMFTYESTTTKFL